MVCRWEGRGVREKGGGGECSVNGGGGGRLLSKFSPTVLPDAVLSNFEMKNVGSLWCLCIENELGVVFRLYIGGKAWYGKKLVSRLIRGRH